MKTDEEILEAAKQAQYETIKRRMFDRYVGGRARIGAWSDFMFSLSSFSVNQVSIDLSLKRVRDRLDMLAAKGLINRFKRGMKRTDHVSYKFNREFCDECAEKAIRYWEEQGYSQDEIRPLNAKHQD